MIQSAKVLTFHSGMREQRMNGYAATVQFNYIRVYNFLLLPRVHYYNYSSAIQHYNLS